MSTKKIQIEQLDKKFRIYSSTLNVAKPPTGWIKAVRLALGMTLQQLANKLNITKQSVMEVERREKEGSITIKTLRETAKALDMELVYGLVPKDGTLDSLIERKARELASKIVLRTSNTMKLEDQENSNERIEKAINDRIATLKHEIPKVLWD
jgi:predicted DNA-binding mobile mystery protein A